MSKSRPCFPSVVYKYESRCPIREWITLLSRFLSTISQNSVNRFAIHYVSFFSLIQCLEKNQTSSSAKKEIIFFYYRTRQTYTNMGNICPQTLSACHFPLVESEVSMPDSRTNHSFASAVCSVSSVYSGARSGPSRANYGRKFCCCQWSSMELATIC